VVECICELEKAQLFIKPLEVEMLGIGRLKSKEEIIPILESMGWVKINPYRYECKVGGYPIFTRTLFKMCDKQFKIYELERYPSCYIIFIKGEQWIVMKEWVEIIERVKEKNDSILKTGDTVIWKGKTFLDTPKIGRVTSIKEKAEICDHKGIEVKSIPWDNKHYAMVTLNFESDALAVNDFTSFGDALKPLPQRITAKFYSWFSSCCLCTVEHPTFGKHQVTPQQYKHSPAEYKNKLRKNVLDMFLKGELDMEKYKKHC